MNCEFSTDELLAIASTLNDAMRKAVDLMEADMDRDRLLKLYEICEVLSETLTKVEGYIK